MATLDERFYECTIPEHGPSPALTVVPREPREIIGALSVIGVGQIAGATIRAAAAQEEREMREHCDAALTIDIVVAGFREIEQALARVGDSFRRMGELRTPYPDRPRMDAKARQAALRSHIMRQCAGMRRRQMLRRR